MSFCLPTLVHVVYYKMDTRLRTEWFETGVLHKSRGVSPSKKITSGNNFANDFGKFKIFEFICNQKLFKCCFQRCFQRLSLL